MGVSEDRLDKYPSGVSKFCDRMVERKKGWLTFVYEHFMIQKYSA